MLVKRRTTSRREQVLAIIAVILLAVTGFFLYRNFFPAPVVLEPGAAVGIIGKPVVLKRLPQQIETDVLTTSTFQKLRVYGNVPVRIKSLGKRDPFGLE